jgi:hypothetical protein
MASDRHPRFDNVGKHAVSVGHLIKLLMVRVRAGAEACTLPLGLHFRNRWKYFFANCRAKVRSRVNFSRMKGCFMRVGT